MTEPRMFERWRLRRAMARQQRRPLWRRPALGQRRHPVEEFLAIPPDLHASDPSFFDELTAGSMGLAGATLTIGQRSPFAVTTASTAWTAELHGFAWLNHLTAAQSAAARDAARNHVHEWISSIGADHPVAWRTGVLARRIISWINHAPLILDSAEPADFERVTSSLHRQLVMLGDACARGERTRLQGLIALVLADLSIKDQDAHLARTERELASELSRQILDDGAHVSRNSEIVLDLLLDLLPLRQTYATRERDLPQSMQEIIPRMIAHLYHMRLGDGRLAAFNGAGRRRLEDLSTVFLYGKAAASKPGVVAASRYLRVEASDTMLIMDCGAAPPIAYSTEAAAGCLAFEICDASSAIFVNPGSGLLAQAGAPGTAPWRATAAHNTLILGEQSSAHFIATADAATLFGGVALSGPKDVTVTSSSTAEGQTIEAAHDGYVARFGLRHTRVISLSPDGRRVSGRDQLSGKSGTLRLKQDVPVAIHFYLHHAAQAAPGDETGTVEIALPGDRRWRFKVEGIEARIEPATFDPGRSTRVIVVRYTCDGENTVTWDLERLSPV